MVQQCRCRGLTFHVLEHGVLAIQDQDGVLVALVFLVAHLRAHDSVHIHLSHLGRGARGWPRGCLDRLERLHCTARGRRRIRRPHRERLAKALLGRLGSSTPGYDILQRTTGRGCVSC